MNLSKVIIYGQVEDVAHFAKRLDSINYLDEYGYTPLIEAIIVDDIEKFKILLAVNDVDVNQKDITGRSPLHWAVSNNNIEICELLLKKGADPNAYNLASEPVLAKPILRNETELKNLLVQYGASYTFAYDYINTKLIGHRFELTGSVDIVDPKEIYTEVDYEGFYLEFSLDLISYSLHNFRQNFAARSISEWFDMIKVIGASLSNAAKVIKFDHYLSKMNQQNAAIHDIIKYEPLIVPISQEGHAITIVKYKDLLTICDRSLESEPSNGIAIYYMNRPSQMTKDFIHDLLFKKQEIKTVHAMLHQQLGLQQIGFIPMPDQVIGNCSWANVEAIIPAIKYMWTLKDPNNQASKDEILADCLELYHRWREWDMGRSLQFMIQSFYRASAARKASIAALLAGVLVQRCSADDPEHINRAKRIIKILKTKGYEYILESYIKFYVHQKKTSVGENLLRLLHIYDIEEGM